MQIKVQGWYGHLKNSKFWLDWLGYLLNLFFFPLAKPTKLPITRLIELGGEYTEKFFWQLSRNKTYYPPTFVPACWCTNIWSIQPTFSGYAWSIWSMEGRVLFTPLGRPSYADYSPDFLISIASSLLCFLCWGAGRHMILDPYLGLPSKWSSWVSSPACIVLEAWTIIAFRSGFLCHQTPMNMKGFALCAQKFPSNIWGPTKISWTIF